ncbi:MAG: guanylate kinase [Candidatus Zambryskibacteria bacterium CG10_big_fil_rev_8_21_14_0_10_42_12]|uniref:Guanylate kinase n=1 Tax=Candidatus Zambryskibacteria bacterium CG10_big_fil_rev_8_21_14_0_10_42_12 TaxID=1975115 RepID=A0A2H0QWD7_9BACT|nr:MAG: guanylate kinase [Candidatus Zambryskibacteria bacterium CG10_big_fil_rev_8_21_14_0_10_42_12]
MRSRGKLIIIVAPSGSGKGTLVDHVKQTFAGEIVFPISCTTRTMRPGEREGDVYNFVSRAEFEKRIEEGYFLEWAEYSGNLYGTPREDIMRHIESGDLVLREVEIQGAYSIKRLMDPEDLAVIYIDAGSWEDLRRRIEERAPLSPVELALRHERFLKEIEFKPEATYIVSNKDGELEQAKEHIIDIIKQLQ